MLVGFFVTATRSYRQRFFHILKRKMVTFLGILYVIVVVAIVVCNYQAANMLKKAGSLLGDSDIEGAGNLLHRSGTIYFNLVRAGIAIAVVITVVSIVSVSSFSFNPFKGKLDPCSCIAEAASMVEEMDDYSELEDFEEKLERAHPECANIDSYMSGDICKEEIEDFEEKLERTFFVPAE